WFTQWGGPAMMRKCLSTLALISLVVVPVLVLSPGPARADGDGRGAVKLLTTVAIPGTLNPLRAFDISWLDADTQPYSLADRSNASVDVVNARTNTFVRNITGGFAGVVANAKGTAADNSLSGPNGVLASG